MRQHRFENSVSATDFGYIHNLTNYCLFEVENLVIAHGLDFCLLPTLIKQEKVIEKFKVLYGQLQHHLLTCKADFYRLARLNNSAHSFCGSTIANLTLMCNVNSSKPLVIL